MALPVFIKPEPVSVPIFRNGVVYRYLVINIMLELEPGVSSDDIVPAVARMSPVFVNAAHIVASDAARSGVSRPSMRSSVAWPMPPMRGLAAKSCAMFWCRGPMMSPHSAMQDEAPIGVIAGRVSCAAIIISRMMKRPEDDDLPAVSSFRLLHPTIFSIPAG
ncbi:hypothetical protein ACFQ4K_01865 [Tistrella bauzanensis]